LKRSSIWGSVVQQPRDHCSQSATPRKANLFSL
jgi:hypothetical protein